MATSKDSVRLATTTHIPDLQAVTLIDGLPVAPQDRVLVKDQNDPTANGIYVASALPTGGRARLNRAPDMPPGPAPSDMHEATIRVSEGNTNAHTQWSLRTQSTITVGTTPLPWIEENRNYSVASIAELKRLVAAPQGGTAAVAGYAKAGDNGGGDFTFIGVPATSRVTKATVVTIDITAMSVSSDHVATFTTAQPHNFVSGQSVFLSDVGTATGAWIITLDPSIPTTRFLVQGVPATAAIDAHTHPRASCVQLTVPNHGLPPGAQRIAVSGVLAEGMAKAAPINQIWDKSAVYDSNTLTLPVPTNGGTYKPGLHAVVGDEALHVTATDEAGTTGGLWQRTVTQPFNVAWWGATGNSPNDESATINAAINAAKRFPDYNNKTNTGTIVQFGPGVYHCASKILIDGSVSLHGASGIGDQASTILFFAKNMGDGDALVDIQQIATDGSGTSAQFLRIYNLAVVQDDTAPLDETVRTVGIRVRAHGVILEDIFVHSIQGCGILIEGDPPRYNADNWCLKGSIRITNCRESGVVTQGSDANAGEQSGILSVSGCGEWGVHEHSFLGNRWDAIHTEGNGYEINSDGLWARKGVPLDPKFTWSKGAHISPGQLMLPTAEKRTGFIYRATDIGAPPNQTASSPDGHEPNWPTKLGLAVPDGDITWTCWAHEGGALWHEGANNCSSYGYIYVENGQNAPHFDNGTASVEAIFDRMTATSQVATATVYARPVPFQVWTRRSEAWDPEHQSSGSVTHPVIVGVGDQIESTVAWLKRADANDDWGYPPAENPGKTAPNVPDHWTHDIGVLWDRWDGITGRVHPNLNFPLDLKPPTHRWRVEWWTKRTAVYPFHSYSQVGGQTLPQPAAICFPSLWLGNKTGCERRLGAVPARTDAPHLPDLSDVDVSGGNAFEQGDVLFNAPKDGQLNWPAAWRAKGRNAIKTPYFNPPGWFPQTFFPAGYVFRVPDGHPSGAGGSMWRARNTGYTTATTPSPTPQTEPAWVDKPGTQVSDGDVIWDWWGHGDPATEWEALITEAQTLINVDVSMGGEIVLTSEQAAHARVRFTGTLAGNATVIVEPGPGASWTKTFTNATSGPFSLRVQAAPSGSGVWLPQGGSASLFTTGATDGMPASVESLSSPQRHGGRTVSVDTAFGTTTTTNAEPVTTKLFDLAAPEVRRVDIVLTVTNNTCTTRGTWKFTALVTRRGNITQLEGSGTDASAIKNPPSLDAQVGVSGGGVQLQCTGLAATDLTWGWEVRSQQQKTG